MACLMGCGGTAFTSAAPDAGGGATVDAAADTGVPSADGASTSDAQVTCAAASITFVMDVAPASSTRYCAGGPSACTGEWLSLTGPTGNAVLLDSGCMTDCGMCQPVACTTVCAVSTAVPAGGVKRVWLGIDYDPSTCGPASTMCIRLSCAPTGQYVAHMCGYAEVPSSSAAPACTDLATTPTCVDAPFEWPPAAAGTVVKGTIGAAGDGGG
jgi:hypothetical protein